jgi:hypothetical protein
LSVTRRSASRPSVAGSDDGSAIVEFVWLAVLLMVPLVYVVLSAVALQRSAFAVTAAASDAGRAYATAGSDAAGERRAELAVALAMRDQEVAWSPTGRVVECGSCDYSPGSRFTVDLQTTVELPLLPAWLCGHTCLAGITVSAHHSERISCYSGTGPPAPDSPC